ncbi:MAG: cation transporter [Pseudomonadales bacterium]|nr:cation transporter [Pseudomonadales bacterium]
MWPERLASGVTEINRQQAAQRSTLVSVGVNTLLAFIQILVGWLSHSQALVADGLHSFADLLADGVVLLANHHSHRDADADHQYGHYRFENAASLALGLLLIFVGGHMLWSATDRLQHVSGLVSVAPIALAVALIALVSKEILFRYLLHVATQVRSSLLIANAWHARSDSLSSLVVSIGVAGNLLGYKLFDPIAALLVGLMVLRMGAHFAWEALNDLMDRAASQEEVDAIHQTIMATPGVLGLHNLRTRKVGDLLMVDVHLEIDGDLRVREGHDIAEHVQERVQRLHRVVDVMTHVDPSP